MISIICEDRVYERACNEDRPSITIGHIKVRRHDDGFSYLFLT